MVEKSNQQFGLSQADMATIQQIMAQFPEVEKAVIFGSRAKGTHERGSDVDIALFGENLKNVVYKIHYQLEEETILPYFFDILDYNTITNDQLKDQINRVGKTFYQRAGSSSEK